MVLPVLRNTALIQTESQVLFEKTGLLLLQSESLTVVNDLDKMVVRKRHKNKEIERAIQFAEKYGWRLRKARGAAHPYGIYCIHQIEKDKENQVEKDG